MKKVFIDGSQGTTGLKIFDRLKKRDDVELLTLPDELRKDIKSRKEALNSADIAFLCLPDAAAIEAAELVTNDDTVIIDTSTAHRTSEGWANAFFIVLLLYIGCQFLFWVHTHSCLSAV